MTKRTRGAAVAHGGILRHLNLRHAISKRTRANFGFTQHEPYNPISHNGHSKAKTTVCKIDNIEYVEDCVRYFIKKVRREDCFVHSGGRGKMLIVHRMKKSLQVEGLSNSLGSLFGESLKAWKMI